MYKELVISIMVLLLIIVGNVITQNNTNKAVEVISSELEEIREEIIKEYVNQEKTTNKMEQLEKIWEKEYEKMAYYIEHNELEKVETEITKLKADIETKEYKMGVENLDNCTFVLGHIKDKSALKIVNVF